MAQCPKCQTQVADLDFGLVICANCGASFLLDGDGRAPAASSGVGVEGKGPQPVEDNFSQSNLSEDWFSDDGEEAANDGDAQKTKVLSFPQNENLENVPMDEWGSEENSKVVTIGKVTKDYRPQPQSAPSEEDPTAAVSHPYDGAYQSENPVVVARPEASLGDIRAFGNAAASQDGSLLYSIRISGIDSPDLRDEVRGVLSDRRLLFDVEAILKGIQSGELVVRDISAIKAQVVVNRLLGLPLQLEWEQNANGNP